MRLVDRRLTVIVHCIIGEWSGGHISDDHRIYSPYKDQTNRDIRVQIEEALGEAPVLGHVYVSASLIHPINFGLAYFGAIDDHPRMQRDDLGQTELLVREFLRKLKAKARAYKPREGM